MDIFGVEFLGAVEEIIYDGESRSIGGDEAWFQIIGRYKLAIILHVGCFGRNFQVNLVIVFLSQKVTIEVITYKTLCQRYRKFFAAHIKHCLVARNRSQPRKKTFASPPSLLHVNFYDFHVLSIKINKLHFRGFIRLTPTIAPSKIGKAMATKMKIFKNFILLSFN